MFDARNPTKIDIYWPYVCDIARYLNMFLSVQVSSLPTEPEALSDVAVDDVMRTAIRCLKNTLQHVHAQTPGWGRASGAVTSLIGGLRVFYVRRPYAMETLKY